MGTDLIVWPESSIPMFQSDIEPFLAAMTAQAKKTNTAWVTGIPYWDISGSETAGRPLYYNSIMANGAEAKDSIKATFSAFW